MLVQCGVHAKNRKGLLLGDHAFVSKLHFVGTDTGRYRLDPPNNDLCGGAPIETPGCAGGNGYAAPPANCGGDTGIGRGGANATVEDVSVAPFTYQVAFFASPTKAGVPVTSGLTIRNYRSFGTFADGINIHGAHRDVLVEGCEIALTGDDCFAIWSIGALADNISFVNNLCSHRCGRCPAAGQHGATICRQVCNRLLPSGMIAGKGCYAAYGGKTSAFVNNTGEDCSTQGNNAMVTFGYGNAGHPTMPTCFGGVFSSASSTTVHGNVGGNQSATKSACVFYNRRCPFPRGGGPCTPCYNSSLCNFSAPGTTPLFVPSTSASIAYANGRFIHGATETSFDWINSQVTLRFRGSGSVSAALASRGAFNVAVDGGPPRVLACDASEHYALASGLDPSVAHSVTLALRTESKVSNRTTPLAQTPSRLRGFTLDAGATVLPAARQFPGGRLAVIGDSITAGWGNMGRCCGVPGARSEPCSEDGTQCYGAMVGRDLGMEVQMIASGGNGFGAGNHSGVDWTEPSLNFAFFQQLQYDARLTNLSEFVPDVIVFNVGTNDSPTGARAAPWETIYVGMLTKLRAAWPRTWFLLGCAPWNAYNAEIESVVETFNDTAQRTRHLDWGNFSAVARGCFNHPSIAGHRTMADTVTAAIRALPKTGSDET